MSDLGWRKKRFHCQLGRNISIRTEYQRDRDRIVHCSAFRRLATITQVVSPDQGYVLHNRLTHALKVAQIGRRTAERLLHTKRSRDRAYELGGLDPDVVETAGLAHDLGHPPFGHAAEKALQGAGKEFHLPDSFEGNAQSLRIVGALAIRAEDFGGLNLTRASINAILKYPWMRSDAEKSTWKKWGAYSCDHELFEWAREPLKAKLGFDLAKRKTLEAAVMDFADDIAYSVYDLEDFTKAEKIPLDRLFGDSSSKKITKEAGSFFDRLEAQNHRDDTKQDLRGIKAAYIRLKSAIPALSHYTGNSKQRAAFRDLTSTLVGRFMNSVSIRAPKHPEHQLIEIPEEIKAEIELLKALTFSYVVFDPALANQQAGYCKIIKDLFVKFSTDAQSGDFNGFPKWVREILEGHEVASGKLPKSRVVVDFIASLTESHAIQLHQRISGVSAGSLFASQF